MAIRASIIKNKNCISHGYDLSFEGLPDWVDPRAIFRASTVVANKRNGMFDAVRQQIEPELVMWGPPATSPADHRQALRKEAVQQHLAKLGLAQGEVKPAEGEQEAEEWEQDLEEDN